jgi:hypothetical protein
MWLLFKVEYNPLNTIMVGDKETILLDRWCGLGRTQVVRQILDLLS